MPDSDLMFRSASELAGMVRAGEVSSRELVEISLARIEELNPELNAFVQVDAERALATAAEIGPGDERPFAGVPIAIKNNRAVQGLRLTNGCSLMAEYLADHDHNVTRRLRAAGFVIVGSTALPEYGILPVSEARIFGPTRNPWDLQRTPGGSSGGAAAAVASGMVPVAHGNDGGGSPQQWLAGTVDAAGLDVELAQQGHVSPDLSKYHFNYLTNYQFVSGIAKGFGVGTALR